MNDVRTARTRVQIDGIEYAVQGMTAKVDDEEKTYFVLDTRESLPVGKHSLRVEYPGGHAVEVAVDICWYVDLDGMETRFYQAGPLRKLLTSRHIRHNASQ